MRDLQKVELRILCEVIRVCEELKLKCFLIGGSMLGAVRHKGFIPWDDDIDIGMMREDYEIFINRAQELLPAGLFVQNVFSEENYLLPFTKIRDSNTTFIESSVKNYKINHGVYLDVFPLDYYPDSKIKRFKVNLLKTLYNVRLATCFDVDMSKKTRIASNLLKLVLPSVRKVLLKREALFSSSTSGSHIVNYGGAWGDKEIMPAHWCYEDCCASFEGVNVLIPSHYDEWLTKLYGDYLKLPPEDKRCSHHYTEVIDLENPYTKYIS